MTSSDPSLQLEERTSPCLWVLLGSSPSLSVLREDQSIIPEAKVRKERTRDTRGSVSLASLEFHPSFSVLTHDKAGWPFKRKNKTSWSCFIFSEQANHSGDSACS